MTIALPLADTVRITEVMLALAIIQQCAEHLAEKQVAPRAERLIFAPRMLAAIALVTGFHSGAALAVLFAIELIMLNQFRGPYNGGASKMTALIVTCLTAYHLAPQLTQNSHWQELPIAYLAAQLTLSYFVSGYIKIINPEWRSGQALVDVFRFSAYPVSERLRDWADKSRALWLMSWGVIGFEVIFPLALLHPLTLIAGLVVAGSFHLSNALFFGLNRFFWIWLCAYPSIIWFQDRVFG